MCYHDASIFLISNLSVCINYVLNNKLLLQIKNRSTERMINHTLVINK